jgi:hypothetical protein
MPDMPANSLLGYIGTFFFLSGIFLILSGLGIIKIQQITVTKGVGTFITGVILAIIGGFLISSDFKPSDNLINTLVITPTATSLVQNSPLTEIPTLIPAYVAAADEEIVNIRWQDEVPALNNALTISLDVAYNENSIGISVRSLGYPREDFSGLSIGDKVVFHGDSDFEILITDYKVIRGFLTDYEIQVVVKRLPKSEFTPTPEYIQQEIVKVKERGKVSAFGGDIVIEFLNNGVLGKDIKIYSSGYVSKNALVSVGSEIKYEGNHKYLIIVTNYDNNELEFTISR